MAKPYVRSFDKSIVSQKNVLSNYFIGQNGRVRQPDNDIAKRLRLLQKMLEGSEHGASSRMARRLDIKVPRWLNILGGMPLSLEVQDRLIARIPGLSVDWIRYGRREGLSYQMAEALGLLGNVGDRADEWANHGEPRS